MPLFGRGLVSCSVGNRTLKCAQRWRTEDRQLRKLTSRRPDLTVLDLAMRVMNGLEAARALKRVMPEVPIVMFSAYADSFTEKEARSAGVSVLVSKFEDISALIGIARNLVYPTTLDHLSAA